MKLSKRRINAFFNELYQRCEQKHTYSVVETAKEMGIDYEQVKEWAAKNEYWKFALEYCRDSCAMNADRDGLHSIIPAEEAFKYLLECDDDIIAMYPTPEIQEKALKEIRNFNRK